MPFVRVSWALITALDAKGLKKRRTRDMSLIMTGGCARFREGELGGPVYEHRCLWTSAWFGMRSEQGQAAERTKSDSAPPFELFLRYKLEKSF